MVGLGLEKRQDTLKIISLILEASSVPQVAIPDPSLFPRAQYSKLGFSAITVVVVVVVDGITASPPINTTAVATKNIVLLVLPLFKSILGLAVGDVGIQLVIKKEEIVLSCHRTRMFLYQSIFLCSD